MFSWLPCFAGKTGFRQCKALRIDGNENHSEEKTIKNDVFRFIFVPLDRKNENIALNPD